MDDTAVPPNRDRLAYPLPREDPAHPAGAIASLRNEAPVCPVTLSNSRPAWLVTSYEHYVSALTDTRLSADHSNPNYPYKVEALAALRSGSRTFISMDPPEHGHYRKMVSLEFSPRRIEALRDEVQRIADDLLDGLLAKGAPADLVTDFALPFSAMVICRFLGVPYEDADYFTQQYELMLRSATTPEQAAQAAQDLRTYIGQLIERKVSEPSDDLLSRTAREQVIPGRLTSEELVNMALLLLNGGLDTTAHEIAHGVELLLTHPQAWEELCSSDDPSVLLNAIEEILRYRVVEHLGSRRVAIEDLTLDGCPIKAGDGLVLSTESANRDPGVFPEPDTFDIHRKNAREHVGFGRGVHICIGLSLARLELEVGLRALIARLPSLRLAVPSSQIEFNTGEVIFSLKSLPVTWTP